MEKKIKENAINEQEIEKFKMKYEERIFYLKLKLKAKDLDLKLQKDSVREKLIWGPYTVKAANVLSSLWHY